MIAKLLYLPFILIGLISLSGTLSAQKVTFDWVKQYGGSGADARMSGGSGYGTRGLTLDHAGNIYSIATLFAGAPDFDPGNGVQNVVTDSGKLILTKSDPEGNLIWVKQFGNKKSFNYLKSVKVDLEGNVIVCGQFSDTADFDPGPGKSLLYTKFAIDGFVAKYDSSGNLLWTSQIGGLIGDDEANDIAVDNSGNIFVVGNYNLYARVGDTAIFQSVGAIHTFVLKLNAAGGLVWVKQLEHGLTFNHNSIALDRDDNIYFAGHFNKGTERAVDFNPSTNPADTFYLTPVGHNDIYIAKWDSAGNFIWTKRMGGSTNLDVFRSLAVDSMGNSYVYGEFRDTADFGNHILRSTLAQYDVFFGGVPYPFQTYTTEIFIAKLNTSGEFTWVKSLKTSTTNSKADIAHSIVLGTPDSRGLYISGEFKDSTDFDPGTGTHFIAPPNGITDGFILRLDTSGNFHWVKVFGGGDVVDGIYALALNRSNSIYSVGFFNTPRDFDPDSAATVILTPLGTRDGFLHKMICIDTNSAAINVTRDCNGFMFNGELITTSGAYIQRLTNHYGCDSLLTIHLTINLPEAVITVNEHTLGTAASYNTYQWFLDGIMIPGATNRLFTVTKNGDYTVFVTDENGCSDTSDIYTVNNVSVGPINETEQYVQVYPNPAQNVLYINSKIHVDVVLTSLEGRIIAQESNPRTLNLKKLSKGVYLLRIMGNQGKVIKVEKIVKW